PGPAPSAVTPPPPPSTIQTKGPRPNPSAVTPPPPPSSIGKKPPGPVPSPVPPPPPSTIQQTSGGNSHPAPQPALQTQESSPGPSPPPFAELQQTFATLPPVDERSLPAVPGQKQTHAMPKTLEAEMQEQQEASQKREKAIAPSTPPQTQNQPGGAAKPTKWRSYVGDDQEISAAKSEEKPEKPPRLSRQEDATTPDVAQPAPSLSVRVSLDRLERMDNQVGELAINRNGLSLQQEQLQRSARDLTHRFSRFQTLVEQLRESSDKMLIAPSRQQIHGRHLGKQSGKKFETSFSGLSSGFDPLEMDQYNALYSQLQGLLEEVVQIEESVDDVVLFTGQSNRTLQDQRQMLNQLRHELMWARMLPLGEILNRFPRVLRDLSTKHKKPVDLKLVGTSVLVDRAVLEKLYDPLLHLLRNAFDHGIESAEQRQALGKPIQGTIEIRAYHQGNKTMIEIRDDGSGLSLEKIQQRAVEKGMVSVQSLANASPSQIFQMIFEPGFSTAKQVSDISGRGVGLDIVRSRLRSLQGTITVTSEPDRGTTFTLCLPLTLTIAKLLVCSVGATAIALPSDSIEEIVVPKDNQVRQSAEHRFLSWRDHIVPIHPLSSLLDYNCPVRQTALSRALAAAPMPREWALPLLVLHREQQFFALEINRLVTEQELVIKPFSQAIAPPDYTYGCTILGDGTLLPVIDGYVLIDQLLGKNTTPNQTTQFKPDFSKPIDLIVSDAAAPPPSASNFKTLETPQILVVDDAATLRRTLALTLQRAGYQVIQARDGREAIERLEENQSVHLVICDIEMPNMNGFEFLNYRRQHDGIKTIPVAMLTSRSNDKHRQLAMHLGADAYFTKPYTEQEFVSSINNILTSNNGSESGHSILRDTVLV
ncbi:MAG: hybrid sensor histidine kinase/response regulator, partial [Leptolyngbyaceae bacterium]|nr:hybrid sensor histidine kinase/response regulator [Leptolyngbyaceae bacterium]